LTSTIRRAYRDVHRGWSERTPILVFPREIPVTGEGPVVEMTTAIEERLKQHFRSKPVHIAWAMKDTAFLPSYLDTLWLDTFPDAGVIKLEDAGHYLQEDAHELITPELVRFVGGL
jgi:haloalkane dehalogenase